MGACLPNGMWKCLPAILLAMIFGSSGQIAHTQANQKCDYACQQQRYETEVKKNQELNNSLAKACPANLAAWNDAIADSKLKGTMSTPDPPTWGPPCHSCDDTSATTPLQTDVSQWVQQSLNPEIQDMQTLNTLHRQGEMANGMTITPPGSLTPQDVLTPANAKCISTLDDFTEYQTAINELVGHLWRKAQDMTDTWHKDPERAYAAIQFILAAGKDYSVAGCDIGKDALLRPACKSFYGEPKDFDELQSTWIHSVVDKIDDEIFEGHQYNLCPSYLSLLKQLALVGGDPNLSQINETLQKVQNFLHFQVDLDFSAAASGNGQGYNVSWQGTAKAEIDIDYNKGCYSTKLDGNGIAVSAINYTIPRVSLVSPHSFTLPVDKLVLTLCDKNPTLVIRFKNGPPVEYIAAGGQTQQSGLLQGTFGMALATPTLAIFGKDAKNATITTSNSSGLASAVAPPAPDVTKTIQSHKGDPSWFLTAEGQAALQQMQAQTLQKVYGTAVVTDINAGGLSFNPGLSARVDWTNGSYEPVSATFAPQVKSNTSNGSASSTLKIQVRQQTQ